MNNESTRITDFESRTAVRRCRRGKPEQPEILSDQELLAEYAASGSEQAFARIVARHSSMVYFAALRQTGNRAAAEDITQAMAFSDGSFRSVGCPED